MVWKVFVFIFRAVKFFMSTVMIWPSFKQSWCSVAAAGVVHDQCGFHAVAKPPRQAVYMSDWHICATWTGGPRNYWSIFSLFFPTDAEVQLGFWLVDLGWNITSLLCRSHLSVVPVLLNPMNTWTYIIKSSHLGMFTVYFKTYLDLSNFQLDKDIEIHYH